jgi:glycosyltransferase involved in cell wall biosynthesis
MNGPDSPHVSVIISFLNEELFLADAIESVLAQSYLEWKLILVDDGSADGSTQIAKKYASLNSDKIIYTDHEGHRNMGLSYSRNKGIAISKGSLIAILDADDVWLKNKLKVQVDLMMANPKAMMLCEASLYWYYPWNNNLNQKEIKLIGRQSNHLFAPFELVKYLYPISDGNAPCPSGIIVRRDSVLKHKGFESHFTGKFQLYEDQAFLHKFYLNEFVYISSVCNNLYRQREGSLVQKITQDGDYESVRRYFFEWLKNYIKQNNLRVNEMNILINKALKHNHPTIFTVVKRKLSGYFKRSIHLPGR